MSEVSNLRQVEIIDMEDGKVTRIKIYGFDGEFVKADEESSPVKITIDGEDISEVIQPSTPTPKDAVLFEDGTEVQLLSGGGSYPLYGYEDGEIYRVESDGEWGFHDPDEVVRIVGEFNDEGGFAKPEQLEVIEKGEFVGNDSEGNPLYVGDYVVGVTDWYGITNTDMYLGKIVEDEHDIKGYMEVQVLAHEDVGEVFEFPFSVLPGRFRKATAEEIAKHT
ncbi:hypothetical protein [Oceanobacillus sojae]|uniref:hypothetical protein n=1 Tax=Oceanobacillus sojae TaxID=582851 RepID=UPI00363C3FF9